MEIFCFCCEEPMPDEDLERLTEEKVDIETVPVWCTECIVTGAVEG